MTRSRAPWVLLALTFLTAGEVLAQSGPRKVFISVDMEGIGGIGTSQMTSTGGKDYALGRDLMTAEVNLVTTLLFQNGVEEILVNDSHGDMRNLRHTELDPRVVYIQGNTKPLGMVQGLDESFDAVVFLGYHARAGTPGGFLAHTGSGAVKGLWLNGTEVGEGGLNAAFAGELGVPVLLAVGDAAFAQQFNGLTGAPTVATKVAIGSSVAQLVHPDVVHERISRGLESALSSFGELSPYTLGLPVRVQGRFASTTRADVLQAIPGIERVDGYTVAYDADGMDQAYRLIRLMYKYISF